MDSITILDGGMGKELRRIGAPFRQPEWSALALLESPDFVADAHRNFIKAGAEMIITNTYSVVPYHIGEHRFRARGTELVELAAKIARATADEGDRHVQVAGSLPPLFGSYEPAAFDPGAAPPLWRALIEPQIPFVDLWIGETLSSLDECRVLLETLANVQAEDARAAKPFWAAFTLLDRLREGRAVLRSGEPVSAIAELVVSPIEAVLFNCSQPEVIGPALTELAGRLPATPLGAYANAFPVAQVDQADYAANEIVVERRQDLTTDRYLEFATEWVAAGATIVGGCCDIYPEHIEALAAHLGTRANRFRGEDAQGAEPDSFSESDSG